MKEVGSIGFPLIVEGITTGECIVFSDSENSEEEVPILYVNSDKYSSACQTEPWDGDVTDVVDYPHIPNIPIFFCTHESPGLVSTQCLIPIMVDVSIGLDSSQSILTSQPSKWNICDKLGTSSQLTTSKDIKSDFLNGYEKAELTTSDVRTNSSTSFEVLDLPVYKSETSHESVKAHTSAPLSVKVKVKRGKKSKLIHDTVDEASRSQVKPSNLSLGKRRRKAKRDIDYEYDVCYSDAEVKVEPEDDDTDEDYKAEKEKLSSDDEFGQFGNHFVQSYGKRTDIKESESISLITLPEKITFEAANDYEIPEGIKVEEAPVSDGEESDDISEGYGRCEEDSDDDRAIDNFLLHKNKNSIVHTVGINDLNSESEHSKRLQKYIQRAKEKYHSEKLIKDDGKVMYKCLKCNEEFIMRLQLKEHKKSHSKEIKHYCCNHCDKVFTEARKYYLHLAFHDRLFECRSCGRRFSLLRNLKKHLTTTHPGTPNQICEVCGNQFWTTKELGIHRETQHNEDNMKTYRLECKHCGKRYVREEAYYQHISKAPYKCSMCDVSLGCEFKLKDHVRYEHGQSVCEFCGKSFKKRSLIHHIKIVHKEACVQCPHCPKKFTYRSKMLAHLDANHNAEKKYKCNQCDYTARTVNTLNLHRRRCHSEPGSVPQYGCDMCDRKFFLPSKLTLHYRTHTGEKPYSCGSCGKAFASKYNMIEHERCVHGERMKLSNPDGTSSVRVVKHRRTPRAPGRRCDVCGDHFPSSAAVLTHMKESHNAQALPTISLVASNNGIKTESQVTEIELNRENYEAPNEQYEVIENSEQDFILSASSNVEPLTTDHIPEYATHVEIDGVRYQVLRQ